MTIFLNILLLILLIIAVLLLLVLALVVRIGIRYDTDSGNYELYVKAFCFKYKILPQKKKKQKALKKRKKQHNKNEKKPSSVVTDEDLKKLEEDAKGASENNGPKEKKTLSERIGHFTSLVKSITDKIKILAPAGVSSLKFEIRRLDIVVGCEDAAKTAISYGAICAAVEGLYAVGQESRKFIIGDKVFLGVDYLSEKFSADIELIIHIKISKLIIPVLKALFM